MKQNAFASCVALAAVLFTTLIEKLRLCSSAEAGIVLKLYMSIMSSVLKLCMSIIVLK